MNWFHVSPNEKRIEVSIFGEIGIGQTFEEFSEKIGKEKPVDLTISSGGGASPCALQIYDLLKGRAETARIVGRACSSAVIIALSAKRIIIEADARMMVHGVQCAVMGGEEEIAMAQRTLSKIHGKMIAVFTERTRCSRETAASWLRGNDHWFSAEDAISVGLADEIAPVNQLPVAPQDAPEKPAFAATSEPGPTSQEVLFVDLLRAFPVLKVRNRQKFFREINVWASYAVKEEI